MYQQLKYNLKKLNIVSLILCFIFLALPLLSIAGRVEAKQALWGDIGILLLLQAHRLRTIRKQLSPGVHLRFFTKLGKTGIYRETLAGFNDPRPKQKHGVLLIHGFSASTSEFKRLFPELDKACVLY
jgi:hypothetical protein